MGQDEVDAASGYGDTRMFGLLYVVWGVLRMRDNVNLVRAASLPVRGPRDEIDVRIIVLAACAAVATFVPNLLVIWGSVALLIVFVLGSPLRFRMDLTVWLVLANIWWCAISLFWTGDASVTRSYLAATGFGGMVFLVARDAISTVRQGRAVAKGFVFGCLVAVLLLVTRTEDTSGRYTVGDLNANYLAYSIATAFALVFFLVVTGSPTKLSRTAYAISFSVLVVGVLLTGTRGALVGLALLVGWLIFCLAFRNPSVWIAVSVFAVAAIVILTGISDRASLVLEGGSRATGDWSGRLLLWPEARTILLDNLLFGVGAGNFQVRSWFGVGAHNFILEIGTGTGIIGIGLFMLALWSILFRDSRFMPRRKRAVLIGGFIAAVAPAYLTGAWETTPAAWFALAIVSRMSQMGNEDTHGVSVWAGKPSGAYLSCSPRVPEDFGLRS